MPRRFWLSMARWLTLAIPRYKLALSHSLKQVDAKADDANPDDPQNHDIRVLGPFRPAKLHARHSRRRVAELVRVEGWGDDNKRVERLESDKPCLLVRV